MRQLVCLTVVACLPLTAQEPEPRVVRGTVELAQEGEGEPQAVFRAARRTSVPMTVPGTTVANRQLIRAAEASPGPFQVEVSCKLYLSLDAEPVPVIQEVLVPQAPDERELTLHAEGLQLADGRVLPGCGPLAELLAGLEAPGARCTVRAQELQVDERTYLHVTAIRALPLPGAFQHYANLSSGIGLPLNKPLWIRKAPEARPAAGGREVLTVPGKIASSRHTTFVLLSQLAIAGPPGAACVGLGDCAPAKQVQRGIKDAVER